MKCLSCDAVLSDSESTLKYETGEFVDLCFICLQQSELSFYDDSLLDRKDNQVIEDLER